MITNTKESNWHNLDLTTSETNTTHAAPKSNQTKIDRIPTMISIVRVPESQPPTLNIDKSSDQQQRISNDTQTVVHHNRLMSFPSSTVLDQVNSNFFIAI